MMDNMIQRYKIERDQNWRDWVTKIPAIKFNSEWQVKIIPPFGGAIARFTVEFNERRVSVYLDCYDALGYFGEPYWEVYPYEDDTYRCAMGNTEDLLRVIGESLARQKSDN